MKPPISWNGLWSLFIGWLVQVKTWTEPWADCFMLASLIAWLVGGLNCDPPSYWCWFACHCISPHGVDFKRGLSYCYISPFLVASGPQSYKAPCRQIVCFKSCPRAKIPLGSGKRCARSCFNTVGRAAQPAPTLVLESGVSYHYAVRLHRVVNVTWGDLFCSWLNSDQCQIMGMFFKLKITPHGELLAHNEQTDNRFAAWANEE